MLTVQDLYTYFDTLAPFASAEDWDNSGLLVGDPDHAVRRVLLCLDLTRPAAEAAVRADADLVLTHHPVIFRPIHAVTPREPWYPLLHRDTAVLCMHTNLDVAPFGVNDALRDALGLRPAAIPADAGTSRFVGLGVCAKTTAPAFARSIAERFRTMGLPCVPRLTDAGTSFLKVAYCGGAGGEFVHDAVQLGAGLLVTGETKYHEQLEALNAGLSLLTLGHWLSEQFVLPRLEEKLRLLDPGLEITTFRQDTSCDVI